MKKFVILSLLIALVAAEVHKVNLEVPEDKKAWKFNGNETEESKSRGSRISGGWTASNTQFPFVAELSINTVSGGFLCTASLISDRWLVGASHCISGPQVTSLRASLGSADRESSNRVTAFSDYFVYFTMNGEAYPDIALFHLTSNVPFSSTVQSIRLPSWSQKDFKFEGYTISAIGWGGNGNGLPRFLQYTNFLVLSQSSCNLDSDRGSYSMCSQSQISSSLEGGDSGGPSIIFENGTPTLVGINVWVVTSGTQKWQGSMRVSSFLEFIRDNTGISIR